LSIPNFIQKVFYDDDTQKGIFTLGEDNKEAKQNIKQAELEIANLNLQNRNLSFDLQNKDTKITENKNKSQEKIWEIKSQYTGGDRVFDEAGFLEGLKGNKDKLFNHVLSLELSEPQRDINQIKRELQELGDGAEQRVELASIESKLFSNIENNSIFGKQIIGNDNSSISGLIKKLGNQDWISFSKPLIVSFLLSNLMLKGSISVFIVAIKSFNLIICSERYFAMEVK
jgi:regulator of replication initiation timing